MSPGATKATETWGARKMGVGVTPAGWGGPAQINGGWIGANVSPSAQGLDRALPRSVQPGG